MIPSKNNPYQIAVIKIKELMESSIISGGNTGKTSLIRSSQLINQIHEAVKIDLIDHGVDTWRIFPPLNASKPELDLVGNFKKKSQDICVVPEGITQVKELLTTSFLEGNYDNYGMDYTEKIISINVRSQLSSLAKNFDTLYERTFAESLNLHLRCPQICLGEVYMIPVSEYNQASMSRNTITFSINNSLEKYIKSFSLLNNRLNAHDEMWKYERVCLLIVDFREDPPKLFSDTQELKNAHLIPDYSNIDYDQLSYTSFLDSLLNTYENRFNQEIKSLNE